MSEKDRGKKIIEVFEGPGITTSNAVGRVVRFEDGTGEVQSYLPEVGWITGGTDLFSMTTALDATEENLREYGYTDEEMDEIFELVPEEFRKGLPIED